MNILITGVSKGLGLIIAKKVIDKGWFVFGISRTITDELSILVNDFPNQIKLLKYDLHDKENVREIIFKRFIKKTPLHGFVNNAAVAYDDIITNASMSKLEYMYHVNVFTPINITKYVIRNFMLNKCEGSIIHISSISVHTGYKGLSMYASSKGSLEAFSKNTAREWGGLAIRSNCIVSGFMDTEMSSSLSSNQKDRIYNRTSLKKPVNPKSIAKTVCFLLSKESGSITGQNIHVDAGTI